MLTTQTRRDRKRAKVPRDLLKLLPNNWLDYHEGELIHYCPFGCCRDREEPISKGQAGFDTLILDSKPRVPALNRWTRMFQPLALWAAWHIHGLVSSCILMHEQDLPGQRDDMLEKVL